MEFGDLHASLVEAGLICARGLGLQLRAVDWNNRLAEHARDRQQPLDVEYIISDWVAALGQVR